jgi:hypothetical protein
MRRITLRIGDVTMSARLLDEEAPAAAGTLWDRLPFEEDWTHSFRSGLMIHSGEHREWDLDMARYPLIENAVAYLAPGDVVVWPQNGMVSIAYGTAEFRWLAGQTWVVTKLAELEGDLEPFARAAADMLWEGAQTLRITRGGEAPEVLEPTLRGKIVEIEIDGETWLAELFEDEAPEYSRAVWDALPLEGPATVTHSSGEVFHCWLDIPDPKPPVKQRLVDVAYRGKKVGTTSVAYDPRSMRGQHPGDLVWGSTWNGIRIVFGQGRFGTQGKFGRIVKGDLASLARTGREIPVRGAKTVRMRRYEGAR